MDMPPQTNRRTVFHVDMDAFYAAVEQLDRPELRGLPVIVGSPPDARGVVATCSYEARRYGVHSALPSRTAGRLCPHGVFLRPRMERYREVSRAVFRVFNSLTPLVEPVSVDEAFLDASALPNMPDRAESLAHHLKQRIVQEVGVTASVGVAPNKFLAKVASDLDKPDGLVIVPRDEEAIRAFLFPLPVKRIWGVGPRTEAKLADWHIRTIGDLQQRSERELKRILGDHAGTTIAALARGEDSRPIEPENVEKSISNETTFAEDVADWHEVTSTAVALAEKVGRRLREAQKTARTVKIKLRWEGFETLTRQTRLPQPDDRDAVIVRAARDLLESVRQKRPVRLVGVGVEQLENTRAHRPVELDLFPDEREQRETQRRLDAAVDSLRRRYGDNVLSRAH